MEDISGLATKPNAWSEASLWLCVTGICCGTASVTELVMLAHPLQL